MTAAASIRSIAAAFVAIGLGTGAAAAQTSYGGYNLGPDYGALVQQQLQQQQAMNQQMQQVQAQVVQRAMQDPRCQAMYQQHRAQGGRLSFEEFAYQYAATGGFTPEGRQRYYQNEAANQAREKASWNGMREAEQNRAAAQQGYRDSYGRNQAEAGRVMQGQSSWVDPTTGQQHLLPYMGSPWSVDPVTGQRFARDSMGNQWAMAMQGYWVPMTPAR